MVQLACLTLAQSGRASGLGPEGPWFNSTMSDQTLQGETMKVKTARRFVARNKWKWFTRICSPSFKKRYVKCLDVVNKYKKEKI